MNKKLIDVLLHSPAVKKLIYQRIAENEVPIRYMCNEIDLDYQVFMKSYMNSTSGKAKVTEEQFRKILDMLGVDIRYQFVINENADVKKMRDELVAKYNG